MPLVTTQTKNNINVFSKELNLITDSFIKNLVVKIMQQVPDCFWTEPASSTGKYHPSYALGEGGLVRHTKAAVGIAMQMFSLEMFKLLAGQQDLVIASLLLHDGLKSGWNPGKYTCANHPVLMCDFIRKQLQPSHTEDEANTIDAISQLVLTHMGQWNVDYRTKKAIMPKPSGKLQNFVHLCDYLASRKVLDFNFEEWDD